ncbi:calcium-binding protein [Neisseria wadsworthii]|uniref:hypothetical protein n=1 Tax=Neisseria wadsworthii TaxID=607711 RepID=UPI000D307AE9|nr:hypothetical protein [Neisseria wadsworthii]
MGTPAPINHLSIPLSQYNLPLGPDFITRAFVFGSEGYEVPVETIQKELVLVVNADGTKEVRGLKIIPVSDNFDFESSSTVAKLANAILEPELDPMNQGKTVYMQYSDDEQNLADSRTNTKLSVSDGKVWEPVTVTEADFRALQAQQKELYEKMNEVINFPAGPGGTTPGFTTPGTNATYTAALQLKTQILTSSEVHERHINKQKRLAWEREENGQEPFNGGIVGGDIPKREGPIVIDLDGDGVETLALKNGIRFDHDKNGTAEQTGWAGKDDGQLVRDLNKNGIIDNGGELFGNNTLMGDGKTHAKDGFEALSRYDDNGNGQIDAGDFRWKELQIWQDADADGVTDKGELKTLGAMGITSIKLGYTETGEIDASGNLHKQSSSATWKDGKTTDAVDVWFRTEGYADDAVNQFTHTAEIDQLPEVIAGGGVYNLRDAMTQDKGLLELVKDYVAEPSEGKLEELIYRWAGTDEIDPDDGPKYVDMRKLAVLEKFAESTFDRDDFGKKDGRKVEEEFDRFADYVAGNIKIQELCSEALGEEMVIADANGHISANWIGVNLHIDKLLLDRDAATASDWAETAVDALTYNEERSDWIVNTAQKFTMATFHYGEVTDLKKLAELDGTVGDDGNNHLKAGSEHNILLEGAVLFGDDGNDKLKGGKDNDVLVGGAGNDKLEGKGGSDLYVFEKDFGKDKIDSDDDDDGSDVIRFAEYLQSDLNFVRSSDNLVITTKEGDNALKVEDFFEDGKDGASIDSIVFADYSFLDKNAIKDLAETVGVGCGSKATDGHSCFKYAEKLSAPAMHSSPALDEATMEIVG